jgi:hypothetical protein
MTLDQLKAQLVETDVLALTAWAEARGDRREGNSSVEERIAVMSVIRNRVTSPAWWGNTYRAVCLLRAAFSCWNDNPSDPNHQALLALAGKVLAGGATGDPVFDETRFLADGIRRGFILDRTGGADHYYAPKAMKAGAVPVWAKRADGSTKPPDAIIGDQHFYKLGAAA